MNLAKYTDHLKRITLTVGAVLFVTLALGLFLELWLPGGERPPDAAQAGADVAPTSARTPLSLTLTLLRLALPVIGALVAIPLLCSYLLSKLYNIGDPYRAHDVLNRIVFGQLGRRPILVIQEGAISYGENSPANRVGGPATLIVYSDTAIVTEQYGRIKRILGPGIHNTERFEKVWEVIDLRPQHWVLPVFALTKEGIPICCQADISFQIDDEPGDLGMGVCAEEPYPFAKGAVFQAATAKWMREAERDDTIMPWSTRVVVGFTEGLLRNILAEYRLDWLIAPPQPDQKPPREEIRRRLEEGLRGGARKVGAKLLSVEIGEIEVKARDEETARQLSEIVSQQRLEAWHAEWEARAMVSRAEGEAELLRMDMARIQAQAEMMVTLTEALQSTITSQGMIEPYILALRFVEALRWMSYNTFTREFMPPEVIQRLEQMQELLEIQVEKSGAQREGRGEIQEGA